MSNFRVLLSIVSAIVLFLYGLAAFSQEVQEVGGEALRKSLGRLTEKRWRAVVLGAVATAIIQSSSAVTSLTVALVEAGALSFRSSLGVLLGANIGTTSTAWLVSLKLTSIGPFFIVFGAMLSAIPTRFKMLGKAAFYFGFIFFSLDVVSFTLKPLAQSAAFAEALSRASTPLMGVLAGLLVTAVVQSSSITTGLCILLVQQNILGAAAAIPIVIGANIGTTATGLVASIRMQRTARRVAVANLCFNVFGVLLFLPFLRPFAAWVVKFAGDPGMAVAWAQLIFNIVMSFAVLLVLRIFERRLEAFDAKEAREMLSGA
ncbi:MAG TPA: Na/Pi symporter [Candidatus Sulfotelmatobacter sp.]|nr:Na/Pi symporter [Candidatus Sulfotelmatobacter sp.]